MKGGQIFFKIAIDFYYW